MWSLSPYPLGPPLPQPLAAGAALRWRGEMALEDLESGCRSSARRSRAAQLLQQTTPSAASGGDTNFLGLWSKARVEGWRSSAESEEKRIKNTEPHASGRGARASSMQQQPEQNVGRRRPQRQLHKKILSALEVCAAQGMGTLSAYLNLVLGKVVRVAWCEATKRVQSRSHLLPHGEPGVLQGPKLLLHAESHPNRIRESLFLYLFCIGPKRFCRALEPRPEMQGEGRGVGAPPRQQTAVFPRKLPEARLCGHYRISN